MQLTTADYALIISLVSAFISLAALAWNVWQKYIFVLPRLQVSFGIGAVYNRRGPDENTAQRGGSLLSLTATNLGPGPVILHSCVVGERRRFRLRTSGLINPIDGDPTSATPTSRGPFSGGLPARFDAGEVKSFYFPYNAQCCLSEGIKRIGVHDTYGRTSWCRGRDMRKAMKKFREEFPAATTTT